MWDILFSAIALVLVIEGMLPFLSPIAWRNLVLRLSRQTDKSIRISGLVCMLVGVVILYIIHH
ncbi:MAG: DUF2065 domain-containing protein [Gammaproteobacteria bacterium]